MPSPPAAQHPIFVPAFCLDGNRGRVRRKVHAGVALNDLSDVRVRPIDHRHVERSTAQRTRREEPAETRADDHDAMSLWLGAWAP